MSAHTPGPWRATGGSIIGSPPAGHFVASTDGSLNHEADARLIAAAPELLAALKYVERNSLCAGCVQIARTAIAKAEQT